MKQLINILLAPMKGMGTAQILVCLWWALSLILLTATTESLTAVFLLLANFIASTLTMVFAVKINGSDD